MGLRHDIWSSLENRDDGERRKAEGARTTVYLDALSVNTSRPLHLIYITKHQVIIHYSSTTDTLSTFVQICYPNYISQIDAGKTTQIFAVSKTPLSLLSQTQILSLGSNRRVPQAHPPLWCQF